MKGIILCEGKIDAALIDYLLKKCLEWQFIKRQDYKTHENKLPHLPVDEPNETLAWYFNENRKKQELAIWSVGSSSNIKKKLYEILKYNQREKEEELRFTKLVILVDHDQREEKDWLSTIKDYYTKYTYNQGSQQKTMTINSPEEIRPGYWATATLELLKIPTENIQIRLLTIIIPPTNQGNLETFLLESIQTMSDDHKQLVENAENFIQNIPTSLSINKNSLKLKAQIGVVFSVLAPDGALQHLNQRIPYIEWENIKQITDIYNLLEQL